MKDFLYLTSYKLFKLIARNMPNFMLDGIAGLIYFLDKKHRKIVITNLDIAFVDMSNDDKEKISKSMYKNLIYNLADFAKNQDTTKEEVLKKVKFVNEHVLNNLLKEDKKVILITAHYGNWELLSLAISSYFKPFSIVGRDLDSPIMNKVLQQNREQFGVEVISKRGAMRKLLSVLKEGKSLLGLLVDQNTSSGIEVDFFGKPAMHTHSVSLLAKKMNAVIVPVYISTQNHKEYQVKFYEGIYPISTDNHEDDILKLTQQQANITEYIIKEKPDEYFWLHKRWKNTHRELYK